LKSYRGLLSNESAETVSFKLKVLQEKVKGYGLKLDFPLYDSYHFGPPGDSSIKNQ
jgi:adenine deaminase